MIGHVSPSQRVLSIERSSSLIRTQGKRYGSRLTRLPRHYGAAATPLVSMISSENVAFALILRPGLYATRAKYHSYRDRAVDAVRSHLNALDIADFDTALLYLGVEQRPVLGAEAVRHSALPFPATRSPDPPAPAPTAGPSDRAPSRS